MKRRPGRMIIGGILLILLITGAVLLLLPIRSVTFRGNEYYSDEQMKQRIFGDELPSYRIARLREIFRDHEDIPFVERYELKFEAGRKITVTVYEKTLAGYLHFQDYYLYFDWDGTIVEISQRRIEHLYEVTGLDMAHAVVGEKLPVDDGNIRTILTIEQCVNEEYLVWKGERIRLGDITKQIRFGTGGVTLLLEDISVQLGSDEGMQEKLFLMADMLPELSGREGTLYLDTYREGASGQTYVFK